MRRSALAATFALTAASSLPALADDCDVIAAQLNTQIPRLTVGKRGTDVLGSIIELKHKDAAALTLICPQGETRPTAQLQAKWDATWPPSSFYDLVASAGALVVANTQPAIRSGAVLCAQRALNATDNSAVFDVNGARFECVTTTGVGGSTRILISKFQSAQPQ